MTLFAVIAWDAPDSATARVEARDAHFAYIAAIVDRMAVAGPLRDASGAQVGSLVIYKCDTREEAESLLRADPYFVAGVWREWRIETFLAAAGEWVGGTIW